uniref:Secreted protein n=1 Tax=Globodera rostochiensis TaxID=31243 RepID=A0A914H6E4_GLORO
MAKKKCLLRDTVRPPLLCCAYVCEMCGRHSDGAARPAICQGEGRAVGWAGPTLSAVGWASYGRLIVNRWTLVGERENGTFQRQTALKGMFEAQIS